MLDKVASDSVIKAKQVGKNQFDLFTKERLCSDISSVYNIIHMNKLHVPQQEFTRNIPIKKLNSQPKIGYCKLYSNRFIACQSKEGDLDSFFAHENHSYSVIISEYGRLRKCNSK